MREKRKVAKRVATAFAICLIILLCVFLLSMLELIYKSVLFVGELFDL